MARRSVLLIVAFTLAVSVTGPSQAQSPGQSSPPPRRPPPDPPVPARVCDRLAELRLPDGHVLCTHGNDPLEAEAVAELAPGAVAEAQSDWPCHSGGPAIHALYAHTAGQTSRLSSLRPTFEGFMRGVQSDFFLSATENGGLGRMVRVLTDAACQLVVDDVTVSPDAMNSFGTMTSELRSLGYNQIDRKYLIWADTSVYCGIANLIPDDTKGLANRNNSSINYARVDTTCWGKAETHEIAHTLGAVQLSAAHSSGGYHCYDEYDSMCYRDGGTYFRNGGDLRYVCPDSIRRRLDCGHGDYYDATGTHPYFSDHFNVATDSRFLVTAAPITSTTSPPDTTTTSSPSTSSSTTTAPPTTSTTAPSSTVVTTTTTSTVPPTTTTRRCFYYFFYIC